jgi:hypothetical protein
MSAWSTICIFGRRPKSSLTEGSATAASNGSNATIRRWSHEALFRRCDTRLVFPTSHTEDDLVAQLRARLTAAEDRHALARELGVTPFKLVGVLRGRWPVDDDLAARLGYRRITRFERIS